MHEKAFRGLMQTEMARMAGYSQETQGKMMEAWTAETNNPKLYEELMKEFSDVFNLADANKNGVLDVNEFTTFMQYNCANMKARFGENVRGDPNEEALWF